MQEYRAFIMGPDGHITSCVEMVCESVEDARQRAKRLVNGHSVELWQRDRKIDRFEPPH